MREGSTAGSGLPRWSVIEFCTLMLTVDPVHFDGSAVATTPSGPVDGRVAGSWAATASTAHSGSRTHRSRVNSSRVQQVYLPDVVGWSVHSPPRAFQPAEASAFE